jgi:hypothetical protein
MGGPVIGEQALDADAVAAEEAHGALEEGDRAVGSLVAQELDVGQAGGVVDRDSGRR